MLYTTSNVSSIAQYGAVGAMEGSQQCIEDFKKDEGYMRFCTCRSREELTGALASTKEAFSRVQTA